MQISKKEIDNYLAILLFVMISFGYIFSTFAPVFFSLSTTPFNIFFRGIYLALALYLILRGFDMITQNKYSWTLWFLLMFLILYSARMFYDVFFQGLVFKKSIVNLYLFAYGGNFIPFLAIAIYARRIDTHKLLVASWVMLFFSAFLSFVLLFKIFGGLSPELFMHRMTLETDKGSNSINPITISLYGSTLALLSFYFLLFKNTFPKLLLVFSFTIGFSLLLMGASRGPQVTFFVCLFYVLGTYIFRKRKSMRSKVRLFSLSGFVFMILAYFISLIDLDKILMFNRFANIGKGLSSDTKAREVNWQRAVDQFLSSPIIGDAYIIRPWNNMGYGTYPHNIYFETFMATGIIGALILFSVLISFTFNKVKNINQVAVYMLFLIPAISSSFSSSLFFNPNFWSALALMSGFAYIQGKSLYINE